MDVENRVASLLREGGAPLWPLRLLHRALLARADGHTGDVETLRSRLRARPDLFVVLERPAPLAGAEHWPAEARRAYESALRDAGFESDALVGAAPAPLPSASGGDGGGAADDEEGSAAGQAAPPAALVARALAQLAAAAPAGELLQTRLEDSLPLAQATMRVLEQAWLAKQRAEEDPLRG